MSLLCNDLWICKFNQAWKSINVTMLTDLNNIYTIKYNATVIIMVISQFCMNVTKEIFVCVLIIKYIHCTLCWNRGHDRIVVGFTTTCAISVYHYWSCEFEPCSWQGVLDTTLCDKVCSVTCGRSVVFFRFSGFLHQ